MASQYRSAVNGERAKTALNIFDQVIKLVGERAAERIPDAATRNAPGIDAAKYRLMPIGRIRTAIAETRLKAAGITDNMADQDHLTAFNRNVHEKLDEIPAALAAGKINRRKSGSQESILDHRSRLRLDVNPVNGRFCRDEIRHGNQSVGNRP